MISKRLTYRKVRKRASYLASQLNHPLHSLLTSPLQKALAIGQRRFLEIFGLLSIDSESSEVICPLDLAIGLLQIVAKYFENVS